MRKTVLLLAVLLGTGVNLLASSAGEARLMKMIPADAAAALCLNCDEWKEAPAALLFSGKKDGKGLKDVDSAAVWVRDRDELLVVLAVLKRPLDLPQIQKMIEQSAASHELAKEFKLELTPAKFRNLPAWNAVAKGPRAIRNPFSFFMVSLPGNVLLFTENAKSAEQAMQAIKGKDKFQFPGELKGSLRAAFKAANPIAGVPLQAMASLALTGSGKKQLKGFIKAICSTPEEAAQLMMQSNMLVSFAINTWFQNDFQLGSELFRELHFTNKRNQVMLRFELTQELLEKLAGYSEKQVQTVLAEQEKAKAFPEQEEKGN